MLRPFHCVFFATAAVGGTWRAVCLSNLRGYNRVVGDGWLSPICCAKPWRVGWLLWFGMVGGVVNTAPVWSTSQSQLIGISIVAASYSCC